jgi:hypothetical protein
MKKLARNGQDWNVKPQDVQILRSLFSRIQDHSQAPVMTKRKNDWKELCALRPNRPMILAETVGVLDELIPLSTLQCEEPWARNLERSLRETIFRVEQVQDDYVVEPWIDVGWKVSIGNYGIEAELEHGDNEGHLGSYHWDAALKNLDDDLDQLHKRELHVDREGTLAWKEFVEEEFGDIMPIRMRGSFWWTTGLTWEAIKLIGLEGLMLSMYDNPDGLHRLMALLRDDFIHLLDWCERENLYTLNNENDYIGSGSIGYTTDLPQNKNGQTDPLKTSDLWGLSESQETVGVSPTLFEEFIFPYQLPVISRFGLSYYGCCEPVHTRIKAIKRIPNLRRVSVSPWCDQRIMADELGSDYIFCRKPNPTLISTSVWDEDSIREDIRSTLDAAGDQPLEFAMKDVHTLNNEPWRLGRWVQIAREEIDA